MASPTFSANQTNAASSFKRIVLPPMDKLAEYARKKQAEATAKTIATYDVEALAQNDDRKRKRKSDDVDGEWTFTSSGARSIPKTRKKLRQERVVSKALTAARKQREKRAQHNLLSVQKANTTKTRTYNWNWQPRPDLTPIAEKPKKKDLL